MTARKTTALGLGLCLMLAGCDGTFGMNASEKMDIKLQHAETSPIPGATAKVLPAPTSTLTGAPAANFCVTEAGYCPLAAVARAGENCLCQGGNLMYGGVTGVPPRYNTTLNP